MFTIGAAGLRPGGGVAAMNKKLSPTRLSGYPEPEAESWSAFLSPPRDLHHGIPKPRNPRHFGTI